MATTRGRLRCHNPTTCVEIAFLLEFAKKIYGSKL